MKGFYQKFITDRSFSILKQLKKDFDFVLIGGWAVYFFTQSLKSKDINIIVDFSKLENLKKIFPIEKNERLKKYQVKLEEIDIDVYLPFYSSLGLPVEEVIKETTLINGFTLPKKEVLLITKINAYQNRKGSIKGQKDLIDILSLVLLDDFDFLYLSKLIKKYHLKDYWFTLEKTIQETKEVPELNLNKHFWGKEKRKLLEKLRRFQLIR